MADNMPELKGRGSAAKAGELTNEGISRLGSRLDVAITEGQKRLDEMHKETRDLQARIARLHETKRKIAELMLTSQDVETLEGLPPLK